MINNIKNNTINEADTKKKINKLIKTKNVETKGKEIVKSQEKLLSLFDDLKTVFNNNDNNKIVNEDNNKIQSEDNNKIVNEDNDVNENDNENDNDNESDDDYDNGDYDGQYYEIRQLNNWFEKIDQTKPLEEQRERGEFLSEYWSVNCYHDNKELNHKIFKAKVAYLLNELDVQIFKKIFGHKFTLVDKLINTTSKQKNQILINDIKKSGDNIFEEDDFGEFVIQSSDKRIDLLDTVKAIQQFNETIQSDLTSK